MAVGAEAEIHLRREVSLTSCTDGQSREVRARQMELKARGTAPWHTRLTSGHMGRQHSSCRAPRLCTLAKATTPVVRIAFVKTLHSMMTAQSRSVERRRGMQVPASFEPLESFLFKLHGRWKVGAIPATGATGSRMLGTNQSISFPTQWSTQRRMHTATVAERRHESQK